MKYDTDLSDVEWALVAKLIPPPKSGGRPRSVDPRRVLDGIFYLLKTGCHWRLLPNDFPHWRTVYGYFKAWSDSGRIRKIQQRLYHLTRRHEGRSKHPSTIIVDSCSVRTGKMGGPRGYDGGKRVKGRKRHVAVDSLGLPLAISVTPANVHDLTGGRTVLRHAHRFIGNRPVKKVYADGGYNGQPFRDWVRTKLTATVRISKNLAQKFKSFVPVSQRWVVERSFSWFYDYRRLTVDYERKLSHSRSMLRLAAIRLMLRRLTAERVIQPDRLLL